MALMRASTCHWLIMMAIIVMTVMVIMVMMVMMVKFFKDWKPHFLDKTGAYHTTVTMEVDNEWSYKFQCQRKSSETFFILKWLSSVNVQARLTPTGWVMLQARQPKQLILSSTCNTNHQSENSIAHVHGQLLPSSYSAAKTNLSRGLSGSECVEQASNSGHRWCIFQSLEDSWIGTQFCFRADHGANKLFIYFFDDHTVRIICRFFLLKWGARQIQLKKAHCGSQVVWALVTEMSSEMSIYLKANMVTIVVCYHHQ